MILEYSLTAFFYQNPLWSVLDLLHEKCGEVWWRFECIDMGIL